MIFNYFTLILLSSSLFSADGLEDVGGFIKRKVTGGWRHIISFFKQPENRKSENSDVDIINFENSDSQTADSEHSDSEIRKAESIRPVELPILEIIEHLEKSSKTCSEDECQENMRTMQKLQSSILAKEDEVDLMHNGKKRTISLKSIEEGEKNKILKFLSDTMHSIANLLIRFKNWIARIFTGKKKPNVNSAESSNVSKDKTGQSSPKSSSLQKKSSHSDLQGSTPVAEVANSVGNLSQHSQASENGQKDPNIQSNSGNKSGSENKSSDENKSGIDNESGNESQSDKEQQLPPFTHGGYSTTSTRSSYYGSSANDQQMHGNMNSAYSHPGAQVGNGNGIHPGEAVPGKQMDYDEISRRVQIADSLSDAKVDPVKSHAVIRNFLDENFKPCDAEDGGRIIGVDAFEGVDRKL